MKKQSQDISCLFSANSPFYSHRWNEAIPEIQGSLFVPVKLVIEVSMAMQTEFR